MDQEQQKVDPEGPIIKMKENINDILEDIDQKELSEFSCICDSEPPCEKPPCCKISGCILKKDKDLKYMVSRRNIEMLMRFRFMDTEEIEEPTNKNFRYRAYRIVSISSCSDQWREKTARLSDRIPIPRCIVWYIRKLYPKGPNEKYRDHVSKEDANRLPVSSSSQLSEKSLSSNRGMEVLLNSQDIISAPPASKKRNLISQYSSNIVTTVVDQDAKLLPVSSSSQFCEESSNRGMEVMFNNQDIIPATPSRKRRNLISRYSGNTVITVVDQEVGLDDDDKMNMPAAETTSPNHPIALPSESLSQEYQY